MPAHPLVAALRCTVKEAVWALGRFEPGPHPPIALFANRRGGSTWLMETLAANRGVRYIDQPFGLDRAAPGHLARLSLPDRSQFIHLDDDDEPRVRAYLAELFSGRLQVNAPWEPWAPSFDRRASRVVLKILNAKPLIDWVDRQFGAQIVYLTRHPIPTALSVRRNGWPRIGRAYLREPAFREQWLDQAQAACAERVQAAGSELERDVLDWVLENLVPLRLLPARPGWLHVAYEEALLDPAGTLDRLAGALHLPDRGRMQRVMARPSRSTRALASTYDPAQDAHARIAAWQARVGPEGVAQVQHLLDVFGVTLYRAEAVRPAPASVLRTAA